MTLVRCCSRRSWIYRTCTVCCTVRLWPSKPKKMTDQNQYIYCLLFSNGQQLPSGLILYSYFFTDLCLQESPFKCIVNYLCCQPQGSVYHASELSSEYDGCTARTLTKQNDCSPGESLDKSLKVREYWGTFV